MTRPAPESTTIEASELRALLAGGTPPVLLDVRSAEEYAAGHVEGAINVGEDALPAWMDRQPRDLPVVTICGKGGGRSDRAAGRLRECGFDSARALVGGTLGWFCKPPG